MSKQTNIPNDQAAVRTQTQALPKPRTGSYIVTAVVAILLTLLTLLALHFFVLEEGVFNPSLFKAPVALAEAPRQMRSPVRIKDLFAKNDFSSSEKLNKVVELVRSEYYEERTDDEIVEAMIEGLLDKLGSPYTFYLNQEENQAVQDSNAGSYSGIGAAVAMQDEAYIISDIFDGAPALEAGLNIGDQVLAVNGQSVDEFKDVSALAAVVRGEDGTTVELTVLRPREEKEYTLTIKRGKISNANLSYKMIDDKIGYVKINQFNFGVSENFAQAMDALQEEGATTVIFDLRNNGGGFASEVSAMLDYLLPKDTLLATAKGRSYNQPFEETWMSTHDAKVPEGMRYTILTNRYTASASELFIGCLRDYGKAELVGETTLGKGVGTNQFDLGDGSAAQITTFHYYLPKGDNVDGDGISPDYEVALDEEEAAKPLALVKEENDAPLQKALELAKEKR